MNLIDEVKDYALTNYWRHSWDVVADRWTDREIAAVIVGARTRRSAIAKVWGVLKGIDAKRETFEVRAAYGCRPIKPQSLFEFLAEAGGLRHDSELHAVLDGNPLALCRGRLVRLVREGGHSLDHARRLCVEADYLQDTPWEGGVSTSSVNDLLELIDRESRGDKQYPYGAFMPDLSMAQQPEDFADVPF